MRGFLVLDFNIPFTRCPTSSPPHQWPRRGVHAVYYPEMQGRWPFLAIERVEGGAYIWIGALWVTIDLFGSPEPQSFHWPRRRQLP